MTHVAKIVSVTSVEVLEHYRLRLGFSDGLVRDVDLTHLREGGPVFRPLADPSYFARVRVDPEVGDDRLAERRRSRPARAARRFRACTPADLISVPCATSSLHSAPSSRTANSPCCTNPWRS